MAELVTDIASEIYRDLWCDVADAPPDRMLARDACELAAQLKISGFLTRRDGTPIEQARAFVNETDGLLDRIEMLGGFQRIGKSVLAGVYSEAAELSDALLDHIVASNA